MSWLGKILGGGVGFMIGGPIGAVLGAVAGHHVLDKDKSTATLSPGEERQGIYFTATFSMLAKLSKADSVVSREEVDAIDAVMTNSLRLDAATRQFAIDIFTRAKNSHHGFEDYARQFYQAFSDSPEVLSSLIDLLLSVAYADGVMHPEEERMIRKAVDIFGLGHAYRQLGARYTEQDSLEKYYSLLGAREGESLAEIKKKYRRLAMRFHPDRLQSRGVSPEFAKSSENRFKDIQHAYDVLEKHLGNRATAD